MVDLFGAIHASLQLVQFRADVIYRGYYNFRQECTIFRIVYLYFSTDLLGNNSVSKYIDVISKFMFVSGE